MRFTEFLIESYNELEKLYDFITEGTGFSIQDFVKNGSSDRNKYFLKDREKNGTSKSDLTDVDWNEKSNYLTLFFDTIPTYSKKVGIINPKGNRHTSDKYLVRIQFEDVSDYLGSRKDFLKEKPKEQINLVKNLVKNGTVKVGSDDKSWVFQGVWENGSKLGFAIDKFPKKIPKGKGIWSKRHKGEDPAIYITKHILETLKIIPFLSNTIAKKIREK